MNFLFETFLYSKVMNDKKWITLSNLTVLASIIAMAYFLNDSVELALHDTYCLISKPDFIMVITIISALLYLVGFGLFIIIKQNVQYRPMALFLSLLISTLPLLAIVGLWKISNDGFTLIPNKILIIAISYCVSISSIFIIRFKQIIKL